MAQQVFAYHHHASGRRDPGSSARRQRPADFASNPLGVKPHARKSQSPARRVGAQRLQVGQGLEFDAVDGLVGAQVDVAGFILRNCQVAGAGNSRVKPSIFAIGGARWVAQYLPASLCDFSLQLPVTTKSAWPRCTRWRRAARSGSSARWRFRPARRPA